MQDVGMMRRGSGVLLALGLLVAGVCLGTRTGASRPGHEPANAALAARGANARWAAQCAEIGRIIRDTPRGGRPSP